MSSFPESAAALKSVTRHRKENWALGLLTIGLVTGLIGLIVGWYLVATSKLWTTPQKFLAAVLPIPVAVILLMFGGGIGSYGCSQSGSGPEVCEPHTPLVIAYGELALLFAWALGSVIYLNRAAARSSRQH